MFQKHSINDFIEGKSGVVVFGGGVLTPPHEIEYHEKNLSQ